MDARLVAAQRGLIWLLIATCAVLLLSLPRPGDARTAHAFDELSEFARSVDLPAVEQTRRVQAMRFAQVELAELLQSPVEQAAPVKRRRGAGTAGPKWRIAEGAAPVLAMADLRLATLADVRAQSEGAVSADVGTPQAEVAQRALTFRLSHLNLPQPPVITHAALELAQVGAEQVQRVEEAEQARRELSQAKEALGRAERKAELAQKRVDARKKRKSRSTQKFIDQLAEATAQRDERLAAVEALQGQYEEKAERAIRASEDAPAVAAGTAIPSFGRLRVTLADAAGATRSLALTVPVERRRVSMPPLVIPGASGSFSALRASSAWEDVKQLEPSAAAAQLEARLSWPSRSYSVFGLACEGSWILQLSPWLVVLALFVAWRRAVGAATSHRLFTTEFRGPLRPVGFKRRSQELVVVVLLPLLACVLPAISLWLLRRLPVLPATALFVSFPFALRLYTKLDELRVLNRSLIQYHSYPPPAQPIGVDNGFEPGAV